MAFWGRNKWIQSGSASATPPVSPWDESKIEGAGYRLSVGAEFYVNGDSGTSVKKLGPSEGFVVKPGQFAFILTQEKVHIPRTSIGFISIRASIKFLGLVNVSGFQVNPGFSGNLIFAVFNAGPKLVNLRQADEIFSLWIADLDEAVQGDFEIAGKVPNNLEKIPSDVINGIAGEALTAYQLSEKLEKQKESLNDLREDLRSLRAKVINFGAVGAVLLTVALALSRDKIIEFFKGPYTSVPAAEVVVEQPSASQALPKP